MKIKTFKIRLADEFLALDEKAVNFFMDTHEVVKIETQLINAEENFWTVVLIYDELSPKVMEEKPKPAKFCIENEADLSTDESKILETLRAWRNVKAKDQKLPNYFIASNKELMSIAKYRPIRKEQLLEIKGFGKHKLENYGQEIMEVLENV